MDHLLLTSDAESVQRGRSYAEECYALVGSSHDARASIALIVSELLTNAIRYGGGDELRIAVFPTCAHTGNGCPTRMRIEVHDGERTLPVIVRAGEDSERGRGMAIVEAVSAEWGSELSVGGKVVWAEVDM
jgi:anti-sigma regulatory factor (Ser/Thr protein kinase)